MSVSELREKEEQDFISKNGLKYIKLVFRDRSLIGAPFSFFHTIKENAELERVLIDNLMNLRTFDNQHVYCPLGIGKHYKHLETFNIIYKNYFHLAKFFKIIFYADMISLTYTNAMGDNMVRVLSHYILSDTEESFIGKMSAWYEILYQ